MAQQQVTCRCRTLKCLYPEIVSRYLEQISLAITRSGMEVVNIEKVGKIPSWIVVV